MSHKYLQLVIKNKVLGNFNADIFYSCNEKGLLHHDTAPALTVRIENASYIKLYFKDGILSRAKGPAAICSYKDKKNINVYHQNSLCLKSRAIIEEDLLDKNTYENLFSHFDYYHEYHPLFNSFAVRKDFLPTIETIAGNMLRSECWTKNDLYHREKAPAKIIYGPNEISYSWFKEGKRHREDGPAWYIIVKENNIENKMTDQLWFIEDEEITKEEHQ